MKRTIQSLFALLLLFHVGVSHAELGYDKSEIRIGNTGPYSGPFSAFSTMPKAAKAYFEKMNKDKVLTRSIKFLSYDDAWTPQKAIEHTRKLVESDDVLLIFLNVGTVPTAASMKYLNMKKVPQLFASTGASVLNQPKDYPFTVPGVPNFRAEGQVYGRFLLKDYAKMKIGVLYQNDDYGKDLLAGLKEALGDKASSMIVAEEKYESTDPVIDSQIINLKEKKVDVVVSFATPKFAAQAIKKIFSLNWHPIHITNNVATSIASVLMPAGLDASKGLISGFFLKIPSDPQWDKDPGMIAYKAWVKESFKEGESSDMLTVTGYHLAQLLEYVLKTAGDNLSRDNIIKIATSMTDLELPMLLPGIKYTTSSTDHFGIKNLRMGRFNGKTWEIFGDDIKASNSMHSKLK